MGKNGQDHSPETKGCDVTLACDEHCSTKIGVDGEFNQHFKSGWWFGTWLDYFSHHIGNVIIPTDEVHHFSEGLVETTNQK